MNKPARDPSGRRYCVESTGWIYHYTKIKEVYQFLHRKTRSRRAAYTISAQSWDEDKKDFVTVDKISGDQWYNEYRKYVLRIKDKK